MGPQSIGSIKKAQALQPCWLTGTVPFLLWDSRTHFFCPLGGFCQSVMSSLATQPPPLPYQHPASIQGMTSPHCVHNWRDYWSRCWPSASLGSWTLYGEMDSGCSSLQNWRNSWKTSFCSSPEQDGPDVSGAQFQGLLWFPPLFSGGCRLSTQPSCPFCEPLCISSVMSLSVSPRQPWCCWQML